MKLPVLRVFTFAVIRGFIPLGVAHPQLYSISNYLNKVIRGFIPLGVAHCKAMQRYLAGDPSDSWLYTVRRCSLYQLVIQAFNIFVIRGFMPLGVAHISR